MKIITTLLLILPLLFACSGGEEHAGDAADEKEHAGDAAESK
ncbi:MAG: hypothetical protein QNJ78_00380 [Gammaproteobacteria bacterium]|nr:hypothetical protein [Gammaproteobacteria bacterium]